MNVLAYCSLLFWWSGLSCFGTHLATFFDSLTKVIPQHMVDDSRGCDKVRGQLLMHHPLVNHDGLFQSLDKLLCTHFYVTVAHSLIRGIPTCSRIWRNLIVPCPWGHEVPEVMRSLRSWGPWGKTDKEVMSGFFVPGKNQNRLAAIKS